MSKRVRDPSTDTRTVTRPRSVNLIALPTRLNRICDRRKLSPATHRGTAGSTSIRNSSPFSRATTPSDSLTVPSGARSSNGADSSSSFPASSFE